MQPKDSTYQQCMTCGDSALKRATLHSTAKSRIAQQCTGILLTVQFLL